MTALFEPEVQCAADGRGWRVDLRGDIDLRAQPQLDEVLARITGSAPGPVLVDMTHLTFLASNGIGFLAQLHCHADPAGHRVTLHGPTYTVRRSLILMGFDRRFRFTAA